MPTPASRPELFDAAVDRALNYALRLGIDLKGEAKLRAGLEVWYLKTRFAYRIPLADVMAVLAQYPGPGHLWRGGAEGRWLRADF